MSCLLRFKFYLCYFSILSLLVLSSCEVLNPEEEIPSYIHIDRIKLSTDSVSQGSNAHKITDAWVYVDEQLIGVFELPATFPVLVGGEHTVKIRGGIKSNGISAIRVPYPFYNFYTTSVNLERGKTVNLEPVVSYFPGTTFQWIEGFEQTGTTINPGPFPTDTNLVQQSSVVFEGAKSGAVYLDATNSIFFCSSPSYPYLPKGEQSVWLELNYKSNNLFKVGVMANNVPHETLVINPTDNWNKIYIDLSTQVSMYNGPYSIFFTMVKDPNVTSPQLYLDNIKLVH